MASSSSSEPSSNRRSSTDAKDQHKTSMGRVVDMAKSKLARKPSDAMSIASDEVQFEKQKAQAEEQRRKEEELKRRALSERRVYRCC